MGLRGWTVGVDFGGTSTKIGLVDARGRIVRRRELPTRPIGRPAAFIDGVSGAIQELTRTAGVPPERLRGVGIGAPGLVDFERGVVRSCVNVPGWRNVGLARALARRLRCACVVDNDANVFALGEWGFGAGARAAHMVCLTLGTGVGGGILVEGRIYRGASGSAGEIGHMVVNPLGHRCGCGSRGCLEAEVGTAAILHQGRMALRAGAPTLRRVAREAGGTLTPRLLADAALAGDRSARRIWTHVGGWLGVAVANLLHVFNPERVVIGGGVANAWRWFAPALRRTVRGQAMPVPERAARIVRARLGSDAGILGAAVLVWSQSHRKALNG